jgi:hypothetical protein
VNEKLLKLNQCRQNQGISPRVRESVQCLHQTRKKEATTMNRKLLVVILSLAFAAMLYAQSSTSIKITGYLIDNACADSAKELATRAKGHTVSCALMDSCEKSGYSVVTDDNKRYKLNEKGEGMAAELLKNTKSTKGVKVALEGNSNGDVVDVTKLTEVSEAIN